MKKSCNISPEFGAVLGQNSQRLPTAVAAPRASRPPTAEPCSAAEVALRGRWVSQVWHSRRDPLGRTEMHPHEHSKKNFLCKLKFCTHRIKLEFCTCKLKACAPSPVLAKSCSGSWVGNMGQAHPCRSWQLQPPPHPHSPIPDPFPPTPHISAPFCTVYTTTSRCSLCSGRQICFFPLSFLARCVSCAEPRAGCSSGAEAPACTRASSATHRDVTRWSWRDDRSRGRQRVFLAQITKQHFKPSHKPKLSFHNWYLDLEGRLSPES